jgi:hypothetical protein
LQSAVLLKRDPSNVVKVSVADVRVEHEVKLLDFYEVAGQGGRIATRGE